MSWVAILDSHSLTLEVNGMLTAPTGEDGELLAAVITEAVRGSQQRTKGLIARASSDWLRRRFTEIALTIWHEKRHFVDLLITNYGNLVFNEHYFWTHNALATIQHLGSSGSRVMLPLDIHADSVAASISSVGLVPESFLPVFATGEKYRRYSNYERAKINLDDQTDIDMGAINQLEQLAAIQDCANRELLFPDDGLEVLPQKASSYTWLIHLLAKLRQPASMVLRVDEVGDVGIMQVRNAPILLVASLMCRRKSVAPDLMQDYEMAYSPRNRLAALLPEWIEGDWGNNPSFPEVWRSANEACSRLFGLSIIEEADRDIEHQSHVLAQAAEANVDDLEVLQDHLALRQRFLRLLQESPESLLSPARYAETTQDHVEPLVVVTYANGRVTNDKNLSGLTPLHTADVPVAGADGQLMKLNMFWTAISSSRDDGQSRLSFGGGAHWHAHRLKRTFSEASRHGRTNARICGAEYGSVEAWLKRQGLDVEIDSEFASPCLDLIPAGPALSVLGRPDPVCDNCGSEFTPECGSVVSPWLSRMFSAYHDALVTQWMKTLRCQNGDRVPRSVAEAVVDVDWSESYFCSSCKEGLSEFLACLPNA